MSISSWLTMRPEAKTTGLKVLALPQWASSSLRAAAVYPQNVQDALNFSLAGDDPYSYADRCSTIMSPADLEYHTQLTYAFDDFLFGGGIDKPDALLHLVETWHAIPLTRGVDLKLKVSLGGNQLIVIESDPDKGVPVTELYEPLLKQAHRLLSARSGLGGYSDPLFVEILDEYMKRV